MATDRIPSTAVRVATGDGIEGATLSGVGTEIAKDPERLVCVCVFAYVMCVHVCLCDVWVYVCMCGCMCAYLWCAHIQWTPMNVDWTMLHLN